MMNIVEYNIPKILFIRGVFIKDCIPIDDIFEKKILEQININNPVITPTSYPSIFVNLNSWIKKVNLKCWYCDLNFENSPLFIPKIIEQSGISKDYNISTYGCFCSFCCIESFTDLHYPKICDNIKIKEMTKFLYKIINGCNIKEILPAPLKYSMNHYGGMLTILEYRHELNIIKNKMKELEYT